MADRGQRQSHTLTWWERALRACFWVALLFLAFAGGILVDHFQLPPSGIFKDALSALEALSAQEEMRGSQYPEWIWYPATRKDKGLVRHDPTRAQPGYTVYSSGHGNLAILVDMDGREVHRWEAPFSKVWPNPKHVSGRIPDHGIWMRRAIPYPNGDLLALYETSMDSPSGYGLAKLDRDSRVIWTYDAHTHHDVDIGPDGTIYALVEEARTTPIAGWTNLPKRFKEEFILILSPDGEERKKLSLLTLLKDSPFFRPRATSQRWDTLHSNTVHHIGEGFASKHEGLSAGDLMVCLRNINLVVAVNPDTESIVWGTTGPWHHPHDPDPLDNGRFLIFDNLFARNRLGSSRVIEFDPATGTVHWEFSGDTRDPLRSDIFGCQQPLPNGNVLINETIGARLIEVTPDGKVVWEYVNPVRGGDNEELIPIVCGAGRYPEDRLPFLKGGRQQK